MAYIKAADRHEQIVAGAFGAAKVVVTVPAPMGASITYQPPLPPKRTRLADSTYVGSIYRAIAVYDRPFWRRGKGGELIGGPAARELDDLGDDERHRAVLEPLIGQIRPTSWHEKSWHTDGRPGAICGSGQGSRIPRDGVRQYGGGGPYSSVSQIWYWRSTSRSLLISARRWRSSAMRS
ncbi:hypothetical protein A5740_12525 [Mycobacterium sp. GA-1841]|uniref:FAD-dependent oxidoreductase n=1 Tax=Mycobacterium sp. GA-1841 TaxID=1834154 RepID=UPI00096C473A|nr:FAD-dependent oxidoreductase [Mycobacterium sp. GA-1841]OMC32666.1 hypothetical protein A5740_12525 [Mycobacterium sp. GA-1841]